MIVDKKTLVLLLPGFPKDENDSTCLPFQLAFARCLKRNYPGINVIVLTLQYPDEAGDYYIGALPVHCLGGRNKGGLSKLLLRRKTARKLEEIHKKENIKAIISFWFGETALAGSRFARKYPGVKHFCWLMGQDAKPGNAYVKKTGISSSEIVALSDFLQDEFEKNYLFRPATVITPGINAAVFGKAPAVRDIDLLAAGSLIQMKRFDLFIHAVSVIKQKYPLIKATLIGDGPEKKKLTQIIYQNKLQDNITVAGELPHPVVLQMMQRTKLFLHTSAYEGFGMVCLEALFGGACVISFTKPLKRKVDGWHFANSIEEMTEKAISLLNEPQPVINPGNGFNIEHSADTFMKLAGFTQV